MCGGSGFAGGLCERLRAELLFHRGRDTEMVDVERFRAREGDAHDVAEGGERRGDVIRQVPVVECLEHLGRVLGLEEQLARVDLVDRQEFELQRGDDVAHLVGLADALAREAELPGQHAESAAEGVADDTDVARVAAERGEAVRGGLLDHLLPHRARFGPRGAGLDVDLDVVHAPGGDQDAGRGRGQAVAGGLDRVLVAVSLGVTDGFFDVLCVLDGEDHLWFVAESGLETAAFLVVAGVSRVENLHVPRVTGLPL